MCLFMLSTNHTQTILCVQPHTYGALFRIRILFKLTVQMKTFNTRVVFFYVLCTMIVNTIHIHIDIYVNASDHLSLLYLSSYLRIHISMYYGCWVWHQDAFCINTHIVYVSTRRKRKEAKSC